MGKTGLPAFATRRRASDDSAFVESLFRTAGYRPEIPAGGFASLEAARRWGADFVHWYNHAHRRSGTGVSSAQRHTGQDQHILAARSEVSERARQRHPARGSGNTRDWSPITVVTLNPERDPVVAAELHCQDIRAKAA